MIPILYAEFGAGREEYTIFATGAYYGPYNIALEDNIVGEHLNMNQRAGLLVEIHSPVSRWYHLERYGLNALDGSLLSRGDEHRGEYAYQ